MLCVNGKPQVNPSLGGMYRYTSMLERVKSQALGIFLPDSQSYFAKQTFRRRTAVFAAELVCVILAHYA